MATSNFCFEHRCIFVTNDDYEMGNVPKMGAYRHGSLRSYPSRILEGYEDFRYFDIVITGGYYEGACIDYVEKDEIKGVEYHCGYSCHYTDKDELFRYVNDSFNHISIYRLRQLCKGLKMTEDGEQIYARIDEYLADKEEERVNKALDEIKRLHGYEELAVTARFSNGETIYRKIG